MTTISDNNLCFTTTSNKNMSHVPKFGTLVPNRVFVGGISNDTTEEELRYFFSAFGSVRDCKIILDRAGISKSSYGFVTFDSPDVAERVIRKEAEHLIFKDRRLNVGPAIRKQVPFSKISEPAMPQAAATYMYPNGMPCVMPSAMTLLWHPDGYVIPAQTQPNSIPVLVSPQSLGFFQSPQTGVTPQQWGSPTQLRWNTSTQPAGLMQGPIVYPVNMGNELSLGQVGNTHALVQSTNHIGDRGDTFVECMPNMLGAVRDQQVLKYSSVGVGQPREHFMH